MKVGKARYGLQVLLINISQEFTHSEGWRIEDMVNQTHETWRIITEPDVIMWLIDVSGFQLETMSDAFSSEVTVAAAN